MTEHLIVVAAWELEAPLLDWVAFRIAEGTDEFRVVAGSRERAACGTSA